MVVVNYSMAIFELKVINLEQTSFNAAISNYLNYRLMEENSRLIDFV
jgi:hypothetical protein